jgi:hypothetical protein
VNCWKPNKSGIAAKSLCDGFLTFLWVATPTADNTTPAAKLAPAEKHIDVSCFYIIFKPLNLVIRLTGMIIVT